MVNATAGQDSTASPDTIESLTKQAGELQEGLDKLKEEMEAQQSKADPKAKAKNNFALQQLEQLRALFASCLKHLGEKPQEVSQKEAKQLQDKISEVKSARHILREQLNPVVYQFENNAGVKTDIHQVPIKGLQYTNGMKVLSEDIHDYNFEAKEQKHQKSEHEMTAAEKESAIAEKQSAIDTLNALRKQAFIDAATEKNYKVDQKTAGEDFISLTAKTKDGKELDNKEHDALEASYLKHFKTLVDEKLENPVAGTEPAFKSLTAQTGAGAQAATSAPTEGQAGSSVSTTPFNMTLKPDHFGK